MSSLFGHPGPEDSDIPHVCDCGHPPTRKKGESLYAGFVSWRDGRTWCTTCAYEREIALFLNPATRRYTAWLSSETYEREMHNYGKDDYRRVTTWYGGHLAWVWSMQRTRIWTAVDGWLYQVRATDVYGNEWVGRGRSGLIITLRRLKHKGTPLPEHGFKLVVKKAAA